MEKTAKKQIARSEEDNLGCVWGLVSLFDFRSTQKLLPDREYGSGKCVGTENSRSKSDIVRSLETKPQNFIAVNQMEARNVTSGVASFRTLLKEEMSRVHPSKKLVSPEDRRIKPVLGFGDNLEKNYKQRGKIHDLASDHHDKDLRTPVKKSNWSNCASKSEKPFFDHDLAALMLEINNEKQIDHKAKIDLTALRSNHHHGPHSNLTQKHSKLQRTQFDRAKAFQNQKSTDAKLFPGNDKFYQLKELMVALESPNLSKNLFSKLLLGQDLILLKHAQDPQDIPSAKCSGLDSQKNLEGCELLGEGIGCSRKSEELVMRKSFHIQNTFFRKKGKSKLTKPPEGHGSDSSLTKDTIVVLKPNAQRNQSPSILISPDSSPQSDHGFQYREGAPSHFSLKEIKRRLRHSIGDSRKEVLSIATNSALHKTPHGLRDSADTSNRSAEKRIKTGLRHKTAHTAEYTAYSSAARRDKQAKLKQCQPKIEYGTVSEKVRTNNKLSMGKVDNPLYHEPFYKKATQNHDEMLNSGGHNVDLPSVQVPNTLDGLLALTGCAVLSPTCSPGRETKPKSPIFQFKQEMPVNHLDPLKQDIESPPCTYVGQDGAPEVFGLHQGLHDTNIQSGEDLILKGNMETKYMEERDHLTGCSEISSNVATFTSERCKKEADTSTLLSGFGPTEEKRQLASSSVFVSLSSPQKLLVPEIFMDSPSPVSVLEPFFFEDISSPGSRILEHVDYSLQPRQLHFEEHENFEVITNSPDSEVIPTTDVRNKEAKFEYVKTLLEASGMSHDKLSKIWHLPDALLDPSLFDEAKFLWSNLPDDSELLFDCTNEVLMEIWDRYYSCTPWLSIIKPDVCLGMAGVNLNHEVCTDIEKYFISDSTCTLDHKIRRNFDCTPWMNPRCQTESTVFEIGEVIFDDLINQSILDLWSV